MVSSWISNIKSFCVFIESSAPAPNPAVWICKWKKTHRHAQKNVDTWDGCLCLVDRCCSLDGSQQAEDGRSPRSLFCCLVRSCRRRRWLPPTGLPWLKQSLFFQTLYRLLEKEWLSWHGSQHLLFCQLWRLSWESQNIPSSLREARCSRFLWAGFADSWIGRGSAPNAADFHLYPISSKTRDDSDLQKLDATREGSSGCFKL